MSDRIEHPGVSPALLPEHDAYVDDAVALGRRELSRADAQRVRERMLRDPVYRGVVEPIVRAYDEPPLSEEDAEIAWGSFVRAAGMPESVIEAAVGTPIERARGARRRLVRAALKVAAVVILIQGVGVAWYYYQIARAFVTVATGPDETIIKKLPDGTVATVGPSSELRFPKEMITGPNTTHLNGRVAYPKGEVTFDVPKVDRVVPKGTDLAHFLKVETPHVWITVWGTRFKVIALPGATLVELEEGTLQTRPRPTSHEKIAPAEFIRAPSSARFSATGHSVRGTTVTP